MVKFSECCRIWPYFFWAFMLERKIAGWKWSLAFYFGFFVLPVCLLFSAYYVPSIGAKVGGPFSTLCILIIFCRSISITYRKAVAEMDGELYLSDSKHRRIHKLMKELFGENYPTSKVTWLPHQFHVKVLRSEAQYADICEHCVLQGHGYDTWFSRKNEMLRQNNEKLRRNNEKLRQENEMLRQESEVLTSQPSTSSSVTESFSIEIEDVSNVESSLMPQVTHRSRHPSSSSTEPSSSSTFVISAEVYRSNSDESS